MSLQQLRSAPVAALQNNIYQLTTPYPQIPTPCLVGQVGIANTNPFCTLRAMATPGGGVDYFFPYTHGAPQGVTVPANSPSGTIAITPGMNGCALEVVVKNNDFVFYHDRNSNTMNSVNVAGGVGTTVCRIAANFYWDNVWANNVIANMRTPIYQFICVLKGGFWHVGCFRFAIAQDGTAHSGGPGVGPNLNQSYVGYFNNSIRLVRN